MTQEQIERIVAIVKSSAGEYPMVYLELLVRRALHEHGAEALPQLSQASEDMAAWHSSQADALEAEGRARGQNVVPFSDGKEAALDRDSSLIGLCFHLIIMVCVLTLAFVAGGAWK